MPTINNAQETSVDNDPADRERMKEFWVKHSAGANIQEMMLDSNAEQISDHELPEILSILPSFKSKRLLELGAGIGRFTVVLAQQAEHVVAVDFIERFIEKNRELNSHLNNIDFVHGDVTKLKFEEHQFHMIFSNWLLMYLNNDEVFNLIEDSLHYLKEGGYFFFRESCFHASGNIKKVDQTENPTEYRCPTTYVDYFQSKTITENGTLYGFELVFARPNRTYIEMKGNGNQVCFLFQKVKLENHHGFKTLKEFMENKQYTLNGILRYERIYGKGFVSTGGSETTESFLSTLNLKPNQRVLDVGCGIGGGDFLMSQKYGVEVYGLDLSSNMIGICWDRSQNYKNTKTRFEIGDVTKRDYPPGFFDVIYSRDSLLHVPNKKILMNRFKSWLKPGGKLFFTDYTCCPKPWSDDFTVYVEQRGYDLFTVSEYESLLNDAGFVNVKAEDKTSLFIDYLVKELENFVSGKEEFLKEFSSADYDAVLDGWKEKVVRTSQGFQKWGAFYAEKKEA